MAGEEEEREQETAPLSITTRICAQWYLRAFMTSTVKYTHTAVAHYGALPLPTEPAHHA